MKNFDIGKKIKELRNSKGLSQEELADLTQLSLRTIQRIENGETEGRGDSLKRLAQALSITPEELTGKNIDEAEVNNKYLILLNLSALSFLVFPILGIIVPLVLWSIKKNIVKNIDVESKRIINFQISWFIVITIIPLLIVIMGIWHIRDLGIGLNSEQLIFGVIALYGFNILYILFNAFRLYKNKEVFYQPAIPFIK